MENTIERLYWEFHSAIHRASEWLHLPLLPAYIHYIIIFFAAYHAIYSFLSPKLAKKLLPGTYSTISPEKRLEYDVDVVVFIQAILNFTLALHVVIFDEERKRMNTTERIWGWTEPAALALAIALGYFYWHLAIVIYHRQVYGWLYVAHAVAVASLMTFGLRPAFMTYAPASFLYEVSNVFLCIHDMFQFTGARNSWAELVNGLLFFVTYFVSRIIWGTYLTVWFYLDIYAAWCMTDDQIPSDVDRMPVWILLLYILSATILQMLNYIWFYKITKMVLRKLYAIRRVTPSTKEL